MNFKRLETFVWAATLGSFRKVADHMSTTQPAISNRIAELESELGVKLFERETGPRPLALTVKGKELLPYAEKMIFMSEQLRKRANSSSSLTGILRLGVSETIVHTWLPEFLQSLSQEMPNLDLEITVDVTASLRFGLVTRSIDLAFLMGPLSESDMVNQTLCSFPLVWVASSGLEIPDRLLYLEELAQWPIITYARSTKPFAEISQRFRELEGLPARFFASSSLAACRRLTIDGVGVSTLPYTVIEPELKTGELVLLRTTWTPSELAFTASYCGTPFNPVTEAASALAVAVAKRFSQLVDN